jgi:hypothetical protein
VLVDGDGMRCVTCGETMRLVQALPDDNMFVSGYEHHILECLGCGETERRLVFRHAGEPWTKAPATASTHGHDEVQVPGADAPDMSVVEPRASSLTHPPRLSREPQQPPGSWQCRIENVRARLDDLRKRAELANQEARAAQQDQEERKRFTLFWEELCGSSIPTAGAADDVPVSSRAKVAKSRRGAKPGH